MRGKRSKQYRKLMHQFGLAFNFREPYQVLVDAQLIQDAARFKMNLPLSLERTLHGQVKPMITQCSIRHLYTADSTDAAAKTACIDMAKTFERRRCNHHTLEEPLSTLECLSSVVDPKSSGTNKHRYVVASQESLLRAKMRNVAGVPLVYVNRSVMIMEPMAAKSEDIKEKEDRSKMRAGLKGRRGADGGTLKRKRDDEDTDEDDDGQIANELLAATGNARPESVQRKKRKGPKGPNPLSVKKTKRTTANAEIDEDTPAVRSATKDHPQAESGDADPGATKPDGVADGTVKRKRKRKHKAAGGDELATAHDYAP